MEKVCARRHKQARWQCRDAIKFCSAAGACRIPCHVVGLIGSGLRFRVEGLGARLSAVDGPGFPARFQLDLNKPWIIYLNIICNILLSFSTHYKFYNVISGSTVAAAYFDLDHLTFCSVGPPSSIARSQRYYIRF